MAEEWIGKLIDRKYRFLSELGHGAMGVVYRAEQLDAEGRPRRIVAVKTLKPEFSKDPDFARRFLREVSVAMQLRSPHALTVYDSGKDESGQLYYVMEFMPQTLKTLLAQGPLPIERAVAMVVQICDALAEAHSLPEPVVHRDIKPANIFVEQVRGKDRVKVGDFGIAKILSEEAPKITQTGAVIGTALYMAPEQWLVQAIDRRADLYALGIMLYEMLTGAPPFSGPLPVLMNQHVNQPPPPLPGSVPLKVREEVKRLLAKEPNDRPADALSVQATLEDVLRASARQSVIFLKNWTDEYGGARKNPTVDEEAKKSTIILPTLLSEVTNSIGMEFILIPPGEFLMGSENELEDEKPVRTVLISRPFYLEKHPVTQGQWEAVMGNNPSSFKGEINRPVETVSWDDAQSFLLKLSKQENGKLYRLPTEAEWEYACRAGSTGAYCFGDDVSQLREYAWYNENAEGTTHPVGQLKPNTWGLYDMHGNLWEWVQDWYAGDYYGQRSNPDSDPQGPDKGVGRVLRGGSYFYDQSLMRCATRLGHYPYLTLVNSGIRIVMPLEE